MFSGRAVACRDDQLKEGAGCDGPNDAGSIGRCAEPRADIDGLLNELMPLVGRMSQTIDPSAFFRGDRAFAEGIELPQHAQYRPLNAVIAEEPCHTPGVGSKARPV